MRLKTLDDCSFAGKTALVRVDFNVPIHDGQVTDTTRLAAAKATIDEISAQGGKVVLLSHFGRPKGQRNEAYSLRQIVPALEAVLGKNVAFCDECMGRAAKRAVMELPPGGVLLLENTRFYPEEEKNDEMFAAALAALGDVFVNDAFSAAHRAHASTEGVARLLPACAGRQMEAEIKALESVLDHPARPLIAIIGGAKVSTKIALLENLMAKVDNMVIGGAMANTFLLAQGRPIGRSLAEPDFVATARAILERAVEKRVALHLPTDFVVAPELGRGVETKVVTDCPADMMILDFGPKSTARLSLLVETCRTLVWNGPLGAFETPPFDQATLTLARKVAALTAEGRLISVAGGGDTVAALKAAGIADQFSYLSTAGGAFLEWLEGRTLPGVAVLMTN